MFSTAKANITTDADGNATVQIAPSINRGLNGFLVCLKYAPGTIAAGADLVITGATSGIPIMTISNAGASTVFYYPRALLNAVADGAVATNPSEFIPIKDEPIQVVIAQGGDGGVGSIEATVMTNPPY